MDIYIDHILYPYINVHCTTYSHTHAYITNTHMYNIHSIIIYIVYIIYT